MKRCEGEHYSNKLNEHKNTTKTVWKILNNIINIKTKPQPKLHYFTQNNAKMCGKENIANGFNDFVTNVRPNLANKIGHWDKHFKDFLGNSIANSIFLEPTSNEQILNIVSNLSNKLSIDKGTISINLVKNIKGTVSEPISHICNISLSQGVFPEEMKPQKFYYYSNTAT